MACKSEFFIAIFCLPIITTTLANANIMDLQHYGSKGKLFCSDSKRMKSPILISTLKSLRGFLHGGAGGATAPPLLPNFDQNHLYLP